MMIAIWRVFLVALALALPSGALAQNQAQLDGTALEPSARSAIAAQIEAGRNSNEGEDRGESSGGPAVDAQGNAAEDPTSDVLALTRAATQRQDDLRNASERFILALREADERLNALRWEHAAAARAAETRRVDEVMTLRAGYDARLAAAEAQRIDAIRSVDVAAAQNASERAVQAAAVLSANADTNAEALRSLVASTEQSVAINQRQIATELSNRLTVLEQQGNRASGRSEFTDPAFTELAAVVKQLAEAQSLNAGRQTVTDPAISSMVEEVRALRREQTASTGQATGASNMIGWIIGGVLFVVTVLTGVGGLVIALRRPVPANGNGNGNGYGNGNRYEDDYDQPRKRARRRAAAP